MVIMILAWRQHTLQPTINFGSELRINKTFLPFYCQSIKITLPAHNDTTDTDLWPQKKGTQPSNELMDAVHKSHRNPPDSQDCIIWSAFRDKQHKATGLKMATTVLLRDFPGLSAHNPSDKDWLTDGNKTSIQCRDWLVASGQDTSHHVGS